MLISEESLSVILKNFDGHQVPVEADQGNKAFNLRFFTTNIDPNFHADIPIDITHIEENYTLYHRNRLTSFNMFLLFHLIKTMELEEFEHLRYRFINDQWYCFNDLPLETSVKIDDPSVQQVFFFLQNIRAMDWKAFAKAYRDGVMSCRESKSAKLPDDISWYGVGHLITSMLFDFTGYTPSQKNNDYYAHAPRFVFSKRRQVEGRTIVTLSCHTSHASFLPQQLERFIKAFERSAAIVPERQRITNYFKRA